MSAEAHEQMHRILNQRQTSELLDIWQKNDRQEWSKEAIRVVGEILQERQVALPAQQAASGGADKDLVEPPVAEPSFEGDPIETYIPKPGGARSRQASKRRRPQALLALESVLSPPRETVSPQEYRAIEAKKINKNPQAIDEIRDQQVTGGYIPAEVYLAGDGSVTKILSASEVESPPGQEAVAEEMDDVLKQQLASSLPWYRAWFNALASPSVRTFWEIAQDPKASLWRAYLWVAVASLGFLGFIVILGVNRQPSMTSGGWLQAMTCLVPLFILLPVVGLTIVAGIAHLVARALGGTGKFTNLVYAFAAILAPLILITIVLSVIRIGRWGLILPVYTLALFGLAIQGVHGLGWGKAALAELASIGLVAFGSYGIVTALP